MRRATTPPALLVALAALSAAVMVAWQAHLTFLIDDWDLLLNRRGLNAHVLLNPHNDHIIIAPAIVYKTIQATIGMESNAPYGIASTSFFIASACLLFVYLRRRIDDWLALAATVLVLFLGAAYEDLLTAFQIGFFGSMACGLGALLALDRRDRTGDRIACALLVVSLTFSEVGAPLLIGCGVAIALDRGPLRRAYVVTVPLVLYGLWYLGWGHTATSYLSFHNVANSPAYVMNGFASSTGSLLGLSTPPLVGGGGGLDWGRPLLVGLLVLMGIRLHRLGRFPSTLLVPLAIALSFWFLTAANTALSGRDPTSSRYQYVGAIFLLLIAAELVRGWRPRQWVLVAIFAATGCAVASNLSALHDAYNVLRASSNIVRGGLGGMEVAADAVNPDFKPTAENSDFNYFGEVRAGAYLSAAEKFGSPAYSPTELVIAPEAARVAADKVLAAALRLAYQPLSTVPPSRSACRTYDRGSGPPPVATLPLGGATLLAPKGVRAGLSLRRFATESFPIVVGTLKGSGRLAIPRDRSSRPWQLQLDATGPVTVCPA